MVSIMNFTNPDVELPPLAKRVLVETAEGSLLFAKRVNRQVTPLAPATVHWIDDQSLPIRSPIIGWKEVVSSGETGQ